MALGELGDMMLEASIHGLDLLKHACSFELQAKQASPLPHNTLVAPTASLSCQDLTTSSGR